MELCPDITEKNWQQQADKAVEYWDELDSQFYHSGSKQKNTSDQAGG